MLRFVIRKMLNNKWMMLCLLMGAILAASMTSSIPMYTDGVLQRMMIKDLEAYQVNSKVYAGRYHISGNFYYIRAEKRLPVYQNINEQISNQFMDKLPIDPLTYYHQISVDYIDGLPEGVDPNQKGIQRKYIRLEGLQGYEDKIKITHGRMPAKQPVDGVYEVLLTQGMMKQHEVSLDTVFVMRDVSKRRTQEFKIKAVGVFEPKDPTDLFWFQGLSKFLDGALMDFDLLKSDFINGENTMLTQAVWYYALDYHKLTLNRMPAMVAELHRQIEYIKSNSNFDMTVSSLAILEKYEVREKQLRTMLWVLQVPILIMLAFYIFMVAKLIIDYEKNEIAVIKSRGASRIQVIYTYFIQSIIINLMAFGAGPYLGLQLCKLIGSSNGFLEFVQRSSLPAVIGNSALLYAAIALVFSSFTMLLPVLMSSKATIVDVKRRKSRRKSYNWVKLALAVIFIGIAMYGQYLYKSREITLALTGADSLEVPLDPALFIMSTIFIMGCGLLMLYLYPYFVRFVFWLGRRFWSPALYASFIQVGRSGGQEQFLMLFLVLTLSIGIFSANAARTINLNAEEKILYKNGADLVLVSEWANNKPVEMPGMSGEPPAEDIGISKPIMYVEPPYLKYQNIYGAAKTARVFKNSEVVASIPGVSKSVKAEFQAFIPDEYGEVVWSRNGLLPAHINIYLNHLTENPSTVFVSENFMQLHDVKAGDVLYLSWNQQNMTVQVAGSVPFWPALNPYEKQKGSTSNKFFIIGNLNYLYSKMAMEPYEVWIKRDDAVSTQEVYDDIEEKKLAVVKILDSKQEIIKQKNDPMLQGLNGAMTMGFIVTMTVSAIGFIIYWILSIRSRVLQFGIFRAIGLKMRKIIGMLICEQILISFVAIIVGIIIGGVTCDIYVPMLEIAYSTVQQVPKFKVIANIADYERIYMIVGGMLLIGFTTLGVIISRIKMSQAIKLGED